MSKEQGHRLIDIIRWGQLFVEGKGKDESLKKLIVKAEANMSRLYISVASEGIKRAIKEKMTDAIFYNPGHELYRLYHLKEITQEEYENNPVKKAHDEYAGAIKFRVGDLDVACVLWAITANNSVPDYKTALNAALDRAEQHIATICKETGCAADIAAFITRELIKRVCKIVFDVYHPKEFDELQSRIEQYTAQWSNLFEQLKDAKTEEEKDLFRAELDKAEKEFNSYCEAYDRKIDRAEGVDEITAAIIKRLFPNEPTLTDAIEKAKETTKSEPLPRIYDVLPNSPVTNLVKRISMSAGKEIAASKNATIKTQETLNGKYLVSYKSSDGNEEYEISIDNIQALKKKQSAKLRKVMNFILIKANEQHFPSKITFTLDEYMSKTGATSKDAAYRAAKKELDMLLGFQIAGTVKRGKKEIRSTLSYVFTGRDVSYNQCEMRCNPDYVQLMCQYFSLLPQWAGELKTKAYDLLDYIYYMARQNTDKISERGHFNISLKAANNYMGSHSPEDTQRHTEYIIDPILNAITEIEETQKNNELKITPVYDFDYKNAHDFLNGYLQIEMEPNALNYYIENGKTRNK